MKIIIKATNAKKGIITGTGAGTRFPAFDAEKFSKEFKLRDGTFCKMYDVVGAQPGDTVVFAYN